MVDLNAKSDSLKINLPKIYERFGTKEEA